MPQLLKVSRGQFFIFRKNMTAENNRGMMYHFSDASATARNLARQYEEEYFIYDKTRKMIYKCEPNGFSIELMEEESAQEVKQLLKERVLEI